MKKSLSTAVILSLFWTPVALNAAQPQGKTKQALLSAARVPVAQALKKPVRFKITHFEQKRDWAFLMADMQGPNGQPVSYVGTPFAEDETEGGRSKDYVALLRRVKGRWTVTEHAIGPTDLVWEPWVAKHRAPSDIFPK
jgi:hypothetical protein